MIQNLSFHMPRGMRLAASHWPNHGAALVLFLHGFMSERTSRGRTPQLAAWLHGQGYQVMSLDFAGSGESDDEPLRINYQVADLREVLAQLRGQGHQRLALWGHSMGARIAIEACDADIATIVSVGGVTGSVPFDPATRFDHKQMQDLEQSGYLTEHRDGPRTQIVVDGRLFDEFAQPLERGGVRCPVLCVHGDADDTERGLLEVTRQSIDKLPAGSRLEVLSGADHTFMSHLDALLALAGPWLKQHLPATPALPNTY